MKRLRYIAIAGLLLLVGWLVINLNASNEPSYQGRKLSQWMNDYVDSQSEPKKLPDPYATEHAAKHAIMEMGTNAIPTLLLWAQATNSLMTVRLNRLVARQHYIRFRFKAADDLNVRAIFGFEILDHDAKSAVPDLMRLLKSPNPNQRLSALKCLERIDIEKRALSPIFVQSLQDPNRIVRRTAAGFLRQYYTQEAEKAGVYKMHPELKPSTTNTVETNSLPAK